MEREETFRFKQFGIDDRRCGMKVGTDGVTLGAWVSCAGAAKAVDMGTGSGLIAIMLAQRGIAAIDAVEIDEEACKDANANFAVCRWSDRIQLHNCALSDFCCQKNVDLIVSNPPFFANGEEAPDGHRALARHEKSLNYTALIDFAAENLCDDGRLAFIYPYGREDEIIYKAEMKHLKLRRICFLKQRADRPFVRTLYEFSKTDGPIETSELVIKDNSNSYTDTFAGLCKDFYLEL